MAYSRDEEIKVEIIEELGVISESGKGWSKQVNIVKWGDNEPKLDIRSWNEDHTRNSKIGTFNDDEVSQLYVILEEYLEGKDKQK